MGKTHDAAKEGDLPLLMKLFAEGASLEEKDEVINLYNQHNISFSIFFHN